MNEAIDGDDKYPSPLGDNIHQKIEDAINARLDLADTLIREANSLMRSIPSDFTQVEITARKEQYP